MTYHLLLVDDEELILRALRRSLPAHIEVRGARHPVRVDICADPARAIERLKAQSFDLILSDYRMPGMDGVAFLKEARRLQPGAARMILSGQADLQGLISAINDAHILRFLAKPWHEDGLLDAIVAGLAWREDYRETLRLADERRLQQGQLTPHELEVRRLAQESPAILHVNWGPDGSVRLDDDL